MPVQQHEAGERRCAGGEAARRSAFRSALGTDGPAGSNNDFDLMEEMNLAADLQKVSTGDPTVIPAEQAVAMATILGARVAGLEKQIGSLETGKRADLITLRLDRPHAVPLYNVYSQIVYALKGSDVEDVMVNGKPIVRERPVADARFPRPSSPKPTSTAPRWQPPCGSNPQKRLIS